MSETLEEKILPRDVAQLSKQTANNAQQNLGETANIIADESLNVTKTLSTRILEGATNFINSEHFIIWVVIVISAFIYTIAVNGMSTNLNEMITDILSGNMLFSLFVLSIIYAWPEYMPNVLKFSNKITFIPYRYDSREHFNNPQKTRKNIEIY